ncbi:MAG: exodeoxyribonuclease VII small subunit [Oscillospiraceae bacterium]|nr:exodeoxyribonuclease VII small subunit [Oscillospiraceae bacterium]
MKKSFEESLKRLEEITALLENGGIELKESLELFSEGTELISECEKYLDEAELKIKKLFNGGATDEL